MGRFFTILVLLFLASACAPVPGRDPSMDQTVREQLGRCFLVQDGRVLSSRVPPREIVAACTAVIQSGNLPANALAGPYALRCMGYWGMGQLDRAIQDCDQSIRLNPNLGFAFFTRAVVYQDKGQAARAIQDYDESLRQSLRAAQALYGRGDAKRTLGDEAGAKADFAAAKRFNPNADQDYRGLFRE